MVNVSKERARNTTLHERLFTTNLSYARKTQELLRQTKHFHYIAFMKWIYTKAFILKTHT